MFVTNPPERTATHRPLNQKSHLSVPKTGVSETLRKECVGRPLERQIRIIACICVKADPDAWDVPDKPDKLALLHALAFASYT